MNEMRRLVETLNKLDCDDEERLTEDHQDWNDPSRQKAYENLREMLVHYSLKAKQGLGVHLDPRIGELTSAIEAAMEELKRADAEIAMLDDEVMELARAEQIEGDLI